MSDIFNVRQAINGHELAATRHTDPKKIAQHELAATLLRKEAGIPEPVSFGRDETHHANATYQRAEAQRIKELLNK